MWFPFSLGIQSPDQQELLARHNPARPVFVEGPFPLWLKKTCVYYYVLRGEPLPPEEKVKNGLAALHGAVGCVLRALGRRVCISRLFPCIANSTELVLVW